MPIDPLAPTSEASYYSALGVELGASSDDIRRAFRSAILKNHPDRNNNSPESQNITILLQEAYAVIGNPEKRAAYDRYLDQRRREEERGRPDVHGWRFDPTGQTTAPRTADGAIIVEQEPKKQYKPNPLQTYWYLIPVLALTFILVFSAANYNSIPKATVEPSVVPENAGGIIPDGTASAQDHITKGQILEDDDNLDDAITQYKSAIAQDSNSVDAHKHLAHALYENGMVSAALLEYQTLVKMAPGDIDVHNGLANVMVLRGDPTTAISELEDVLHIDPKNVVAYETLGSIYANAQQYQLAVNNYRTASTLDAKDTQAMCNLGNTLSDAGNFNESIDEYRSALQVDPNCKDAQLGLAKSLYMSGQKLAGEVELTGVLKMKQEDADRFLADLGSESAPAVPLAH
jgi:Tfp pilus assembly protein PilF